MVLYDKLGRTWKKRKVVWVRRSNACRCADYTMLNSNGGYKLTYSDKGKSLIRDRKGMYDSNGIHVQDTFIETIPALEGVGEDGKPSHGTWEHFPSTFEAESFIQTIKENSKTTDYNIICSNNNNEIK